jgi:AcrR family transcriptional regulator
MYAATACNTCESLRAAALQLVGERGFMGLSVGTLCAATGLTPDEFFDHYPTPDACLYDAYDELSQDLLNEIADSFSCALSWPEALTSARSRILTRLAQHPEEARMLFVETLRGDRELRRRREQGRQRMLALILSEHRRRAEPDQLSPIQLEMLLGASFHLIASRVMDGQVDDLPDLCAELSELTGMFEPLAAAV